MNENGVTKISNIDKDVERTIRIEGTLVNVNAGRYVDAEDNSRWEALEVEDGTGKIEVLIPEESIRKAEWSVGEMDWVRVKNAKVETRQGQPYLKVESFDSIVRLTSPEKVAQVTMARGSPGGNIAAQLVEKFRKLHEWNRALFWVTVVTIIAVTLTILTWG